jgi:hypothetical protein
MAQPEASSTPKIGARRARHFPLCNILITKEFAKKFFLKKQEI